LHLEHLELTYEGLKYASGNVRTTMDLADLELTYEGLKSVSLSSTHSGGLNLELTYEGLKYFSPQ